VGLTTRVTSGTRLERLVSRCAGLATARSVRVVGQLLLLVGLVFVGLRLRSLWHEGHIDLRRLSWPPLVGAALVAAAVVVATGFIWILILRLLGGRPRPRWVAIFVEAQIGKYIPGSVWHYAGRAALAGVEGLRVRATTVSVSIELAASVVAAAVVGMFVVGSWTFAVVAAATAFVLALLSWRSPLRIRHAVRAGVVAVPLYVGVSLVLGIAFWLTARALLPVGFDDVGFYTGAFALAWVVGLVAIFAPVGLGIREAILVALLRSRLGTADAVVLAVVFRGVLTVVDVGTAAAAALVLRYGSRSRTAGSPGPLEQPDA
jgi:glycosyltransferase 2 family protein